MTTNGTANFEIPAEMRAFAEKSVEQAKQAFDSFISAAQHAVNTADSQAANARTGAKEVGELAIGFTKRNIAPRSSLPKSWCAPRIPRKLTALHAEYVKSQIAALTEQAKELSKQATKLAGQH